MIDRLVAEAFGTFWLVLVGCGAEIFAAGHASHGIGPGGTGIGIAFGLSLATMAYSIGRVSGCHLNPAVTVGLWVGGRFPVSDILPYWFAQLIGAVAAAVTLAAIASGRPGFDFVESGLAANGYGAHSPGGYSLASALAIEVIMTMGLLVVILASTGTRTPARFAPIAIGLTLIVVHLVSVQVTNASVNPARSTGPALVVGGWAIRQLWAFWIAPLAGAVAGGALYRALAAARPARPDIIGEPL